MAKILFSHAASNENGQTAGGKAGDQTKNEVRIQEFFEMDWEYILRPLDPKVAEDIAKDAEIAANNENIGYDQPDRYSFYEQAKAHNYEFDKIDRPCNTDCSQMCTTLAIGNGVPRLSKYVWTANMVEAFQYTKAYEIIPYQSKTQLRRGDFLLTVTRHHVVTVIKGYEEGETYSSTPQWVGEAYGAALIPVYASTSATKKLTAYPNLATGNLFDVCDESGDFYYIRIAGMYYGWIKKQFVLRKTPYAKGVVQTDLHMRANAGTTIDGKAVPSLMIMKKSAIIDICDVKKAQNGADWYHIYYKGLYGFCSARYVKIK